MSLCLGRGVCRGCGSQASGFPARSGACGLHSHHPCCSASERCCCLLIMLIIENYRFSVGNVYLHPTFPKLPISIAVMSHPPARFRQRWPFCLRAACCCREGWWRGPHVGMGDCLLAQRWPMLCACHRALGASAAMQAVPVLCTQAEYLHPLPAAWKVPAQQCRRVGDCDGCHLAHRQWLMGLSRGTVRAIQVSPARELCFPAQPFAHS